jgi:hypothetical protein
MFGLKSEIAAITGIRGRRKGLMAPDRTFGLTVMLAACCGVSSPRPPSFSSMGSLTGTLMAVEAVSRMPLEAVCVAVTLLLLSHSTS